MTLNFKFWYIHCFNIFTPRSQAYYCASVADKGLQVIHLVCEKMRNRKISNDLNTELLHQREREKNSSCCGSATLQEYLQKATKTSFTGNSHMKKDKWHDGIVHEARSNLLASLQKYQVLLKPYDILRPIGLLRSPPSCRKQQICKWRSEHKKANKQIIVM